MILLLKAASVVLCRFNTEPLSVVQEASSGAACDLAVCWEGLPPPTTACCIWLGCQMRLVWVMSAMTGCQYGQAELVNVGCVYQQQLVGRRRAPGHTSQH